MAPGHWLLPGVWIGFDTRILRTGVLVCTSRCLPLQAHTATPQPPLSNHAGILWQQDDLASATPRAFLPAFLLALLWALAARRRALAAGLTIVSAGFYPVVTAIGAALLVVRLVEWRSNRPRLSRQRADWLAASGALVLGAAVALLPGSTVSRFGAVVTLEQARAMPEFSPAGRRQFFVDDPVIYWLVSPRSGLDLTATDRLVPGLPLLVWLVLPALLLPILLRIRMRPRRRAGALAYCSSF